MHLFVDGCDTRENLAFDSFKQGAAASRYVRYALSQTELVDASYRVATAYQREGTVLRSFYDGLTYGT